MIQTTVQTITPIIARKMLLQNINNRPLNQANLQYIITQIKLGNYHLTGEAIKFSKNGTLIDGQHRLMAVVETGISIKSLVVDNLEEDVFKFLDTGRNRQAGDVLTIEGCESGNTAAATIKAIMVIKRGAHGKISNNKKSLQISNFDVSEFYQKNKDSVDYSIGIIRRSKNKYFSNSYLAAYHFVFKAKYFKEADEFFQSFGDGVNLAKTNPAHILREKFMADKINKLKMPQIMKQALIIKAFNSFVSKRPIKKLYWDSKNETFPKII